MKVIVTGGGKGIGAGITRVLAGAGHSVGILGRDAAALDTVAAECGNGGHRVHTATADVRDAAATTAAIDQLAEQLGGLDALVNNAGRVTLRPFRETTPEEWHDLLATNVLGVVHSTRAALPHFARAGHGHLVQISSISGHTPLPNGSAYAASKYAVTGLSESLFLELRHDGIKVTTVFPGSVASESHGAPEGKVTPEEVGEAVRGILETAPHNLVSRLEIRPLTPPGG